MTYREVYHNYLMALTSVFKETERKHVINLGHYAVEDIELNPNTVMISINEEDRPLYKLECGRDEEKVFTTRFTDITADVYKNGTVYHPISDDQATAMYRFIAKNKDKHFVVHCAAGISRSGAVALFIHNEFGHKLKDDFWGTSTPNPAVLGKLLIAKCKLNKEKK